jgi:hypothetical protein
VDPFEVRYCPYRPQDEGVYIVKVFAATQARFYWEISWSVTLESTGETFYGDFSTKLMFTWSAAASKFSLFGKENLIDLSGVCYSCTTLSKSRWTDLQIVGNSAFWPLVVTGAPYYISDYQGREIFSSGKACKGNTPSQCYQTLKNGIYLLRLGGGLFGRIQGFPMSGAHWQGCGESGGDRDQLIFMIANGECIAIQKYSYPGRCVRPPPINSAQLSGTLSPTFGGTVPPTQSVYGETYVSGQMYGIKKKGPETIPVGELLQEETVTSNIQTESSEQEVPKSKENEKNADDDSTIRNARPTAAPTESFIF